MAMNRKNTASVAQSRLRRTMPRKKRIKHQKHLKKRIRSLGNSALIHEISNVVNKNQSQYRNTMLKCRGKKLDPSVHAMTMEPDVVVIDDDATGTAGHDRTIDLCADDSLQVPQQVIWDSKHSPDIVIDLCKEPVDDVTVANESLEQCGKQSGDNKTVVVDLLDTDDSQENVNDTNDDILVIASFSRKPLSGSPSNKINYPVGDYVQLKNNKFKEKNNKPKVNLSSTRQLYQKNPYLACREMFLENSKEPATSSNTEENIYMNTPVNLPKYGLRPIIIDGSNVAIGNNNNGRTFCCKRLEICIKYFKERGHKVTAFVPQFRTYHNKSDNPDLLNRLVSSGHVILTPSKRIGRKSIVPYDDRFIVQTAVLQGGIIVTRDNYRDLLAENPAWAETINYRTLPYTWVGDILMFPKDPLGENGPSLEEFLRFN